MGTMVREYESLFVLHPDLTDDVATSTIERLKEVITKMGGELLSEDHWGKKKLSFPVKKQGRGNYVLFHYVGPTGTAEELERTMRNLEQVIRFLTSAFGTVTDVEARRVEVKKRAHERAAARARQEQERQEREERIAREASEGRSSDRPDRADRGDRGDRGDREGRGGDREGREGRFDDSAERERE